VDNRGPLRTARAEENGIVSNNRTSRILVADDDPQTLKLFQTILAQEGYRVTAVEDGEVALSKVREEIFDVVLADLVMEPVGGLEILEATKRVNPGTLVVIITGNPSVESSVAALKKGAHDYILKPVNRDDLLHLVGKAIELRRLGEERRRTAEALQEQKKQNVELRKDLEAKYSLSNFLGESPRMRQVYELLREITRTDSTVLILGESGTGKGLVARTIHYNSSRKEHPFIETNCTVYTESLLNSELFGHEKGAFTGAISQKKGRFELANGGTVFLDEIGDISAATQLMLLRFLQERRFERVGGEKTLEVDVRVIAATNKNLLEGMEKGHFRNDLYYRLNVIPINLPALRERAEDIPLLSQQFLERFSKKIGKPVQGFSSDAMDALTRYRWPGNIRELENVLERTIVLAKNELIDVEDLPVNFRKNVQPRSDVGLSLYEHERLYILKKLAECKWNKKLAASVLGINRSSLYSKLKKYGINPRSPENS
jgi:DNA-binding NtrC family response regulator